MSTEFNKALVRRWIEEGWNTGDLTIIDTVYAPDIVQHDPASPVAVTSSEGLRMYVSGFLSAFPDLHFSIDDLLAEDDKVLWRFTARGTHTGPLMDIPPSGKRATVTGMALFRLAHGKVAEVWVNIDTLGMLQSIGVIPTMA
ncbi:MAG: ester cyclase [Herpetosiphon sp.]